MDCVELDRFDVQSLARWSVWQFVCQGVTSGIKIFMAITVAEVRSLVHVLPKSVKLQQALE